MIVSMSEAARRIGVSATAVMKMIQRGAPVVAPGRGRHGYQIDLDALVAWREARRQAAERRRRPQLELDLEASPSREGR